MSNRKELSRIADTFSERRDKRTISDQADFTTFGLGFETDDIQMSYYKKDKVKVTTHINKDEFDKIIYTNAAYIIDYLKEKNFIK
jgi:hypothetical protein